MIQIRIGNINFGFLGEDLRLCLSVVFVDVFSRGDRGETDPCYEKSPATVLWREARGFKGLLQNW